MTDEDIFDERNDGVRPLATPDAIFAVVAAAILVVMFVTALVCKAAEHDPRFPARNADGTVGSMRSVR